MKFRLLPILILVCIAVFVLRTFDMYDRKKSLSEILFVSNIGAAENEEEKKEEKKDEEKKAEDEKDKDEKEGGEGSEKAENKEKDSEEKDAEKKEDGDKDKKEKKEGEAEGEKKEGEEAGTEGEEGLVDFRKELTFTETEVEILKRLQQRRAKLDQWEETLKVKDNVLKVTQTKIDQKLQELRTLKAEVEGLLKQYNEKEDAKIRSLVKIYESMKPKDAAKIFEDLDMNILLQVVDKMKEAKSALILAKMNSEKAKELTVLFAQQRKLSEPERQ